MKYLFIFSHQDDEFGVFGEISKLINNNQEVNVVYLTSGNPKGDENKVRNAESLKVLGTLGVAKSNIYFLGQKLRIPDGCLPDFIDSAYVGVAELIHGIGVSTALYVPAWEGGHQDHDAAHLVGVVLAERHKLVENIYQFPMYRANEKGVPFFKLFSPLVKNGKVFRDPYTWRYRFKFIIAFLTYRSQTKTLVGLFPFYLYYQLVIGYQILQTASSDRVYEKPHLGMLLYEKRKTYRWSDFAKVSDEFLGRYCKSSSVRDGWKP